MTQAQDHFRKSIATEAMRMMDEESLSMDEAFEKARQEFAGLPEHATQDASEHLAVAEPVDTD